ncbi:MAG: ABC transporter ATP-binding protein [Chloroflexota bacterium]
MTMISVENVSKQYVLKDKEIVQAVDDVSLKVSEGGKIALIGPSGCGKTTLLRMIAGLEDPDSGRVLYNDEPIKQLKPEHRGIGMVFQNYALIPQWDSKANIGFFLRLRQREEEVPERVQQIAKITGFGIERILGKFPKQLSGGEKQRVAIARAFARDLKLLLFDEPFANLDAKLRQTARVEARKLLSKYPVTLIYVTHDQQEASLMADRLILMNNGCIEQVGSYQSLYDAPANIFVAEFIGTPTMNLFQGEVRDGRWYGADFGGYPVPVDIADGTLTTLGIRPEHIVRADDLQVIVKQTTPYFAERFLLVDVTTPNQMWQVQLPLETQLTVGDTLTVSFDLTKCHFFDTQTGERFV